jgi:hypothetical protein
MTLRTGASVETKPDLPQTCHKPKTIEKENGGFPRITADRYFVEKAPRIGHLFPELSAKPLILNWRAELALDFICRLRRSGCQFVKSFDR